MSASHHFLHFLQPPPQNSSSSNNNNSINNENIMRVWNLSLNRYQAIVPKAESEFANAQSMSSMYICMYIFFFIKLVICKTLNK